jgi:TolB-like protein
MGLVSELKRRNVFRMAFLYLVAAWLIMQIAEVVITLAALPRWAGQFVLTLLTIGYPIALIGSWFYELTPEGISLEKEIKRHESITHLTGRRMDLIVISLLCAAVILFAVDKFILDPRRDAVDIEVAVQHAQEQATSEIQWHESAKTVAVLPFVTMSNGPDDEYFADGLSEEIINALSQLPELLVIARTSSFAFKGQNVPIPEVADKLGVAHIVEGSVRRDGVRVRITAQLIRASDGMHLWSKNYDRTLEHIFTVQEDIAENIVNVLGVVLDDNARIVMRSAGIRDVDAYIAYQKGIEAWVKAHELFSLNIIEPLSVANSYFDLALEAAPNLTMAHVMKADRAAHIIIAIAEGARDEKYPGEAKETLAALREHYDLAWRLSPPGNQRDILDVERILFSENWRRLPDRIQRAMQPGRCPQMNWTDWYVGPFGWAEEIAVKFRETLTCDPLDVVASFSLPLALIWAGDTRAALQAIEEAENKGLGHPWLDDGRFWALLAAGRVNDPAVRGPRAKGSIIPYPRQILREALAGDPEVARRMANDYWSRPDIDDWSSLVVAAVVGDRDRANRLAARIDRYPGSAVVFSRAVFSCFCGAPFDLEVTPNYKAHIDQAEFPWPPQKRIDYPTKSW